VKNIKQTCKFPAFVLLTSELPDKAKKVQTEYVKWESAEKRTKAEIKVKRAEYLKALPPKIRTELKNFNVELPIDNVEVKLSLGSFLYDLYCINTPPPKAPLALHVYQRKAMEYATILDNDEFGVPSDVMLAARQILSDDTKWEQSNFSVWIDLPPEKKGGEPRKNYITLKEIGVRCFTDVINAAVAAVYDEEQKEKAEEAESAGK